MDDSYPKTIYSKWDGEDDLKYLTCNEDYKVHSEKDETVMVAEYQFVGMRKVVNRTTDETTLK